MFFLSLRCFIKFASFFYFPLKYLLFFFLIYEIHKFEYQK